MTKSHLVSRRVTATLAIVFLVPALVLFLLWSSISMKVTGISEQDKLTYFMQYFPGWFQNMVLIHIIALSCSAVSILFAVRSFSKHLLSIRVLMLITVLVALFIIIFNLSQMI
jgi:hypothetical protein